MIDRSHFRKLALIMATGAAVLVLGACGGGGGGDVAVELNEFTISASPSTISAGTVTFNIDNAGEFGHEFAVVRTDLAVDQLPVDSDGGADASQLDIVGSTPIFEPGSQTLELQLTAGTYVLLCNIVFVQEGVDPFSHYHSGMATSFTVDG